MLPYVAPDFNFARLLCVRNNVWITSSRMHDPKVVPRILGCHAENSLPHSLKCEALWTLVYTCFNPRVCSQTVPERACVHNLNTSNLALLCNA